MGGAFERYPDIARERANVGSGRTHKAEANRAGAFGGQFEALNLNVARARRWRDVIAAAGEFVERDATALDRGKSAGVCSTVPVKRTAIAASCSSPTWVTGAVRMTSPVRSSVSVSVPSAIKPS